MPRKEWRYKNRYCWNSNLSEELFLNLLKLYCHGHNCSKATKILGRYAKRFTKETLSRQTANKYYLLFNDYLYWLLPEEQQFAHVPLDRAEDANPKTQEYAPEYNSLLILLGLYQAFYGKIDYRDEINNTLLGYKTQDMHAILTKFSKSKRGFPLETFCGHFAFCMWLVKIKELYPEEHPPRALYVHMKENMQQAPIGTFYMESVRIVRSC